MMEYVGTVPRRYVACLDVLGFSKLVEQDLLRLYDAYWSSVQILKELEKSARFIPDHPGIRHLDGTPEPGRMVRDFPHIADVTVFSDSVFIFTDDESQDSLNELCEFCYQIYDIFLQRGLALRGAIAGGEAVVLDKVHVGQAIIDAHKLEESLDLTGIVLADGLTCAASSEARVTFKPKEEAAAAKKQTISAVGEQKIMRVVRHRSSIVDGKHRGNNFQFIRLQAGEGFAQRYKNSEPVVAAMLKCVANDLRLMNDPEYVPSADPK